MTYRSPDPAADAERHYAEMERRHEEWLRTAHTHCKGCYEEIQLGEFMYSGEKGHYCSVDCAENAGENLGDLVKLRVREDDCDEE